MRADGCCKRIPGPGASSWRRRRVRAKFASIGRSLGNCCAFARWVRSAKMQTPVLVRTETRLTFQTANLVPAARWRPGFPTFHPNEGWAERRQAHRCSGTGWPAITLQAGHPAGCPRPSKPEGRAPLGAPPWRFWVRSRASISGIASGSVQRAPRGQVVVPGGRGTQPPEASGYEPQPRDATPRSAFRIVSRRRPSLSRDGRYIA